MTDRDLFGAEIPSPRPGARTDAERKRERRRAAEKPRGYAAPPGSGPAGETCKSCRHSYRRDGANRNFWKCDLIRATKGPGTDIRVSSPACSRWEQQPPRPTSSE